MRRLGGNVVLHGDAFDEALAHARALEAERGLTFVPPYDDPHVIAAHRAKAASTSPKCSPSGETNRCDRPRKASRSSGASAAG